MPSGGVPLMVFLARYTKRKSEAQHIPSGLGISQDIPRQALEGMAGLKDIRDSIRTHTD